MADVSVNSNKRTRQNPDGEPPSKNLKKPSRSESNFLPPISHRVRMHQHWKTPDNCLKNEMKKRTPNAALVSQLMNQTFSLRRKEIVEEQPPVKRMLERWPALFRKQQVFAEFTRVASKPPQPTINLRSFKYKKGIVGRTLAEILAQVEMKDSDAVRDITQIPVGILTVVPEDSQQPDPNALHLELSSIGIILEGSIVMDNIESHAQTIYLTFGLIYNLHLNYPKRLKNTFDFIQRVMLNLGVDGKHEVIKEPSNSGTPYNC
ncbi:hypothetical protein NFI96_009921 [Prochilodus magdalenae]|nr:hypothetical protein NFI96_009921 [Prochilodus magdalenae]